MDLSFSFLFPSSHQPRDIFIPRYYPSRPWRIDSPSGWSDPFLDISLRWTSASHKLIFFVCAAIIGGIHCNLSNICFREYFDSPGYVRFPSHEHFSYFEANLCNLLYVWGTFFFIIGIRQNLSGIYYFESNVSDVFQAEQYCIFSFPFLLQWSSWSHIFWEHSMYLYWLLFWLSE